MKKINATEQTSKMDRDKNNDNGEEQSSENETARGSDNDGDTMTATFAHTYIQRNARNRRFAKSNGIL